MELDYTKDIPFATVNDRILDGMRPRPLSFYFTVSLLALFIVWGLGVWIYQVKTGMVVTGLNNPVSWGVYITNFVFWVGIAHSGTLISAILYLVRSKWRDAVSRTTEAMTVIAIMTAGMFPLVHLGRVWKFLYILPYPNQRALYPNFMSPLVWDVIAVLTYFTVSVIFFYFGLIPDAAAARDQFSEKYGENHWKTKLFRYISLGWSGTLSEWRHYNRGYLYFAAIATPLVISVHSIVSWDFAVSLLPGWHSTLFPPYFVAGAIHSGLAMALILMIPMRKWLNLKELITDKHLEMIAKVIIFTGLIIAYAYIIEPLIEIYSGDKFHIQFGYWRLTGRIAWMYYLLILCNVLVPLTFLFPQARRNIQWLFIASVLINIGMWYERFFIITGSTSHDFMPHNWGGYHPTWVELSIFGGLTSFFFFMFLMFSKLLPTISIADFKDYLLKNRLPEAEECEGEREPYSEGTPELQKKIFVFPGADILLMAVKRFCEKGFMGIETFSPAKLPEVEKTLGVEKSPIKYWTFLGGVIGFISGYLVTVESVKIYNLIAGGKPSVSLIPYVLIMFEFTILLSTIFNFIASLTYTRLYKLKIHPYYDKRFSRDKFGLLVTYRKGEDELVNRIIKPFNAEEIHEHP